MWRRGPPGEPIQACHDPLTVEGVVLLAILLHEATFTPGCWRTYLPAGVLGVLLWGTPPTHLYSAPTQPAGCLLLSLALPGVVRRKGRRLSLGPVGCWEVWGCVSLIPLPQVRWQGRL